MICLSGLLEEHILRMENKQEGNQRQRLSKSLRYFLYIIGEHDGIKRLEAVSDTRVHFEPFYQWNLIYGCKLFLSNSVVHWSVKQHRSKVSFNGYSIFQILNSIGDLKLLWHLDLADTEIEILPNSVSTNQWVPQKSFFFFIRRIISALTSVLSNIYIIIIKLWHVHH